MCRAHFLVRKGAPRARVETAGGQKDDWVEAEEVLETTVEGESKTYLIGDAVELTCDGDLWRALGPDGRELAEGDLSALLPQMQLLGWVDPLANG